MTIYNYMGYHTKDTGSNELPMAAVKMYNIYTGMSYFPVLGAASASARVVSLPDTADLALRVYAFVRAFLEVIGLGILFLIPDIAVSVHRHFCNKTPDSNAGQV